MDAILGIHVSLDLPILNKSQKILGWFGLNQTIRKINPNKLTYGIDDTDLNLMIDTFLTSLQLCLLIITKT